MNAWRRYPFVVCGVLILMGAVGCDNSERSDERDQQVGYRAGTFEDDFLSNGERGNMPITEIGWSGTVRDAGNGVRIHDPDDIFLEIQNKHPRPIYLTRWQLIVRSGTNRPGENGTLPIRPNYGWSMPERENGQPVQPNEFVIIARKRDGAFRDADYYIEDLDLPFDFFQITIRDIDDRLIEQLGDDEVEIFAGSPWDGVVTRSMERVQLIFNNRGNRETNWHTYAFNPWEEHEEFRLRIHEDYRTYTFASPGFANTPDYSGNTAAGDFQ
ncbi:MAG: hypothetical protein AAFS10_02020 [Myxococcota bacterium]